MGLQDNMQRPGKLRRAPSLPMQFGGSSVVIPPVTQPLSIFGFRRPANALTTFDGSLLVGAEQDATDAARWSRQNNDPAITIAPGRIAWDGLHVAARWAGYTDEEAVASGDRISVVAKLDSLSGGNAFLSSNVGSVSSTASARIGWKQGSVAANAAVNPRVSLTLNAMVTGVMSRLVAYNLTKLLKKKWFVVLGVGQSNGVGATAVADPALDTPAEGCVVFPGSTNPYTGYTLGVPAVPVDPIQHQTLNGSTTAYGGGPIGAYLRALRKEIPDDYVIVFVATNYAGEGFKANGLWNKLNTARTPDAYNAFWSIARDVWSKAPAGSVMGGVLFCGGESDLGTGNIAEWLGQSPTVAQGVPAFLKEVRAEPGWGEVPIVFMEIGMVHTDGNVIAMNNAQKRLCTGSGDALEFTRCRFSPRPASYTLANDNVHYEQPSHRQRGADTAKVHLDIIYNR